MEKTYMTIFQVVLIFVDGYSIEKTRKRKFPGLESLTHLIP